LIGAEFNNIKKYSPSAYDPVGIGEITGDTGLLLCGPTGVDVCSVAKIK